MPNYFILKTLLEDDATPHGGTSKTNETLGEFTEETGLPLNIIRDREELNHELVKCGIQPIKKED